MKRIFIICVVFLMSATAFAQQEEGVTDLRQNKFGKNWELRVNLAAQSYMGEYVKHFDRFARTWTFPSVGLGIQKWATPNFGFGLELTYSQYKGFRQKNSYNTFATENDEAYGDLFICKGHMLNIAAKVSSNLANLFDGYKEYRVFNPVAYIGGGFLVPISKVNIYRPLGVTFNAGMLFQFRVHKHWTVDLNIEGAIVCDNFEGALWRPGVDPKVNVPVDGILRMGAGFTYQFGYVKNKKAQSEVSERVPWVKCENIYVENPQNDTLRQQLAEAKNAAQKAEAKALDAEKTAQAARQESEKAQQQLQNMQQQQASATIGVDAQVEQLRQQLTDAQNQVRDLQQGSNQIVFDKESRGFWQIITFFIDKYEVTNRQRVNLMAAADIIKATPGLKYSITGYADSQTASSAYNLELSKKRVNTVYDILVNEMGIPADRLVKDYKGGVDNLFLLDPECSRAVVIKPIVEE